MHFRVLGCHGGETPRHRTSAFLIDDQIAIDAGSLTGVLSLEEQQALNTVLVSHPHMDHIRDLGTLADNRYQQGGPTVEIVGIAATIEALRAHFFNDRLWPDFTKIDAGGQPVVRFRTIEAGVQTQIGKYKIKPIMVNHTVDTSAFIVAGDTGSVVYGGDTGPTDLLWKETNALDDLRAVLVECSLPTEQQKLATNSGHHTPASLQNDLEKLQQSDEVPVLIYHMKPVFEQKILKELAHVRDRNFDVLQLEDEFLF